MQSDLARNAAAHLQGLLLDPNHFEQRKVQEAIAALQAQAEAQGDALVQAAASDFLPPLERSDLLRITRGLAGLVRAAYIWAWPLYPKEVEPLAAPLLHLGGALQQVVSLLPEAKKSGKAAAVVAAVQGLRQGAQQQIMQCSHGLSGVHSSFTPFWLAAQGYYNQLTALAEALEAAVLQQI